MTKIELTGTEKLEFLWQCCRDRLHDGATANSKSFQSKIRVTGKAGKNPAMVIQKILK